MATSVSGRVLISSSGALLLCLFLSPRFIVFLRNRAFGQNIREEGPEGHKHKAGTPTMGGIIIVVAFSVPFLCLSTRSWPAMGVFATTIACAALGFADDYMGIVRKRSLGLRARTKLIATILISVGFWWIATQKAHVSSSVELRPFDVHIDFGPFFVVLIYVVVAGTTSGVDLADGLDGLAAGCVAIAMLAYIGITFVSPPGCRRRARPRADRGLPRRRLHRLPLVQRLPGVVFMGDTGSLALGGALAGLAIMTNTGLLLVHRRDLRDRGAVGPDPGVLVPRVPQARLQDGAAPPPLRARGLVGDEDHAPLLDRRRRLRSDRIHAVPVSASRPSPSADGHRPRPPLPAGPFLVLGLARSGRRAALALRARGEEVIGCDAGATPELDAVAGRLRAAGVEVHLDASGEALAARVQTLIKSPGVPARAPGVLAARRAGVTVIGELELAWRLLDNAFVAVTGTNGKTTTTEWIGHIHRAAGAPVAVAGNVGTALSGLVGELARDATVICEASSFQLEDAVAFAPEVAVLLNVTPDHLDRHGSLEAYEAAKLRIFANQGPEDVAVLPDDLDVPVGGRARQLRFGDRAAAGGPAHMCAALRLGGGALRWDGRELLGVEELPLPGAHNLQNAMAAATACLARGLEPEAVAAGLRSFRGVAHRLELIDERGGVRYVNDSKATNVASTIVALRSYAGGVHLIAGGRGKSQDFSPLAPLVRERCAAVYLIGEDGPRIGAALRDAGAPLHDAGTLAAAVGEAAARARPGDVVLLSPACASFDQFRDFEERGEQFRRLVLGGGETPEGAA